MDERDRAGAWLRLSGHEPVPARLDVVHRARRTRMVGGLLSLLGFWALAPLVALLPPHVPWLLGALAAGVYFGYKQWNGEYEVRAFAGECPRCRAALAIAPGTRIRLPHRIDCFHCHHEPSLQLAPGAA